MAARTSSSAASSNASGGPPSAGSFGHARTTGAGCRHRHGRPRRRRAHDVGRSPRSPSSIARQRGPRHGDVLTDQPSDRTVAPSVTPQPQVPSPPASSRYSTAPPAAVSAPADGIDLGVGAVPVGLDDQQCGTSAHAGRCPAPRSMPTTPPRPAVPARWAVRASATMAGHTGGGCGGRGKERHRCAGFDRPRPQPQGRLDHDAQRALRADEQRGQVVADDALDGLPAGPQQRTVGQHDGQPEDGLPGDTVFRRNAGHRRWWRCCRRCVEISMAGRVGGVHQAVFGRRGVQRRR